MSKYSERFWKKSWDDHVKDLDPKLFETTFIDAVKSTFEEFPQKMAFSYLGVEFTYAELDKYSNQFANMLIENGFNTGDVVGICLPNMPEYVIALIGALRAGCLVSGVSPLLSTVQIQYQLNDLGSTGKNVGLITLMLYSRGT